jgi:hypothetical protein
MFWPETLIGVQFKAYSHFKRVEICRKQILQNFARGHYPQIQ